MHDNTENVHDTVLSFKDQITKHDGTSFFYVENRYQEWLLNLGSLLFSSFGALCNM